MFISALVLNFVSSAVLFVRFVPIRYSTNSFSGRLIEDTDVPVFGAAARQSIKRTLFTVLITRRTFVVITNHRCAGSLTTVCALQFVRNTSLAGLGTRVFRRGLRRTAHTVPHDQRRMANSITWQLAEIATHPTVTIDGFVRITAVVVGAWHLQVIAARFTYAVYGRKARVAAAVVACRLIFFSALCAEFILNAQIPVTTFVTGDLAEVAAESAEVLQNVQAWIAACIARNLEFGSAGLAELMEDTETRVADPIARKPVFDAACDTGSTGSKNRVIKFAMQGSTEATRSGLSSIGWTAWRAILGAAWKAAVRLLVARAASAHLLHVPGIRRVNSAVSRPFRCTCFRTVAADLAGAAAGRNAFASNNVATQARVATHERPVQRDVLNWSAAAGLSQPTANIVTNYTAVRM